LFDGNFSSIPVPEGAGLNEVLELLESFVLTSISDLNLTFSLGLNCFGLAPGVYGYNQLLQAIIDKLCSSGSGGNVLFESMPIQLSIDEPGGFPYTGTPFTIGIGGTLEISPITLTVENPGDYIVSAEFVVDGGTPKPAWVGYEIRVNGTVVPYSTRVVRIMGGTPSDRINSFCVSTKALDLSEGDEISLWICNQGTNIYNIIVIGSSLEARSF
jgi:hypothetical protein